MTTVHNNNSKQQKNAPAKPGQLRDINMGSVASTAAQIKGAVASTTTATIIITDLERDGLDALFEPVTWRRLQRCSPAVRDKIRVMLPRFTFRGDQ